MNVWEIADQNQIYISKKDKDRKIVRVSNLSISEVYRARCKTRVKGNAQRETSYLSQVPYGNCGMSSFPGICFFTARGLKDLVFPTPQNSPRRSYNPLYYQQRRPILWDLPESYYYLPELFTVSCS